LQIYETTFHHHISTTYDATTGTSETKKFDWSKVTGPMFTIMSRTEL
jgi:hypothetical protein